MNSKDQIHNVCFILPWPAAHVNLRLRFAKFGRKLGKGEEDLITGQNEHSEQSDPHRSPTDSATPTHTQAYHPPNDEPHIGQAPRAAHPGRPTAIATLGPGAFHAAPPRIPRLHAWRIAVRRGRAAFRNTPPRPQEIERRSGASWHARPRRGTARRPHPGPRAVAAGHLPSRASSAEEIHP